MAKSYENEIKGDEAIVSNPIEGKSADTLLSPKIQGRYLILEANGDATIGDYTGGQGLFWDQSAGTLDIAGGLTVDSIDIPDTTTANSFHVNTTGDTWWGSPSISGSVASVSSAGTAVFKDIKIGGATLQYTVTNEGIFNFGDGSDGDVTTSGNVTLTADKYYDTLTIATGDTVNPAGYRIFCKTALVINGTGKIAQTGNNGGTGGTGSDGGGGGGTAGAAGAAVADGYLKGSVIGVVGGVGASGVTNAGGLAGLSGNGGTAISNSIGGNGSAGGAGGNADTTGGSGGGGRYGGQRRAGWPGECPSSLPGSVWCRRRALPLPDFLRLPVERADRLLC